MSNRLAHLADRDLYRAFYEAPLYEGRFCPMQADEPRLRWALLHVERDDDVVDIGCHKGEMTGYLRNATEGRVVGVDIAASALRDAAHFLRGLEIEWVQGDAERLPLPDDAFDLAVICEVLEHVIDPDAVIAEAERVVRPGGTVVVSVPVDAIAMCHREREQRDAVTGLALDAHVRDYLPSVELAGKKGLRLEYASIRDAAFRLASFEVSK